MWPLTYKDVFLAKLKLLHFTVLLYIINNFSALPKAQRYIFQGGTLSKKGTPKAFPIRESVLELEKEKLNERNLMLLIIDLSLSILSGKLKSVSKVCGHF